MNAQDALSQYFVEQGLFPEGSSVRDYLEERWYRIGGLPVLPLVGKIKQSLILHDVHHLVTGYETTWTGELELAGWELGSGGCHTHFFFWLDRLGAFAVGLLVMPQRVWRALRSGRRSRNLYRLDAYRVLEQDMDALRTYVVASPQD